MTSDGRSMLDKVCVHRVRLIRTINGIVGVLEFLEDRSASERKYPS
jgi:hypothetical protein